MKMIKAMKKLKFWSRKKRKKKHSSHDHDPYFDFHHQPPPSTYHHSTYHHHHSYSCTSSSSAAQPSAPPLPPWLEPELTHEPVSTPSWVQFTSQEAVQETSPMLMYDPTLPVESTPSSYQQQYMDPNTVYGLPVLQTKSSNNNKNNNMESKSGGVFGCFVKFGLNLVGCFFPCLSIPENHHHDRLKLHAA